ncbi:MAG: hypothetical protein IPL46_02765 [Saprospiraceae bacterium]|nr:hypothetical protein [Saprospiraceae bacterium]
MLRIEKRGDKNYIIFRDGELEQTKEEIELLTQRTKRFENYLDIGTRLLKDNGFTIESTPKTLNIDINLEMLVGDIRTELVQYFKETGNLQETREIFEAFATRMKFFLEDKWNGIDRSVSDRCLNQLDILRADIPFFKNDSMKPFTTSNRLPEKPIFNPEVVPDLLRVLKNFFNVEHQIQLKYIIETGRHANEPLIFLDHGNRLADSFKQLIENDLITGCQKKALQEWIIRNFQFVDRGMNKSFTNDYAEKCISRNYYPCKKPIFQIIDGKIEKC